MNTEAWVSARLKGRLQFMTVYRNRSTLLRSASKSALLQRRYEILVIVRCGRDALPVLNRWHSGAERQGRRSRSLRFSPGVRLASGSTEGRLMHTEAPNGPRRIEYIVDNELRPGLGVLLRSSLQSGWSGFLFERRQVLGTGVAATMVCPLPRATLVTSGALKVAYRAGFTSGRFLVSSGSTLILPGNYEMRSLCWTSDCELLQVEINVLALRGPMSSNTLLSVVQTTPQLAHRDRQIATLIRGMEAEAMGGCLAGPMYAETLSLTLAAYVAGRYSTGTQSAESGAGRLSPRQVSRVRDHIRANLGSRLSLTELAAVVPLSPYYFSQMFRNAVGAPPHEYVLRERIRAAATLLTTTDIPLAEVASMVGFASQSHFAHRFRRATAMTPRQYRNAPRQAGPVATVHNHC
jgi:AraC family transcriptional regulator